MKTAYIVDTYRIDYASTDKAATTSMNSSFDCLVVVAVGLDAFEHLADASYFAVLQRSAHFLSAYTFPYADFDEPGGHKSSGISSHDAISNMNDRRQNQVILTFTLIWFWAWAM